VSEHAEQVKVRIPKDLNNQVCRMAGRRTSKSAWIEEAIRQRVGRESDDGSVYADLPPAARERIAEYASLVRAAVEDEELEHLEQAWKREEDPEYYGLRAFIPSTLDASIDVMVGRGAARRVPAAAGCA
jgi:hypothetical protein